MTLEQSNVRLFTYVNAGVLSAFIAGVPSLDTSDWRKVSVFFAGIILAGNNALRAYIDGSVRDIKEPILPDGLPKADP
jgi:hypothetical protein